AIAPASGLTVAALPGRRGPTRVRNARDVLRERMGGLPSRKRVGSGTSGTKQPGSAATRSASGTSDANHGRAPRLWTSPLSRRSGDHGTVAGLAMHEPAPTPV